jgi:hypothetical protein
MTGNDPKKKPTTIQVGVVTLSALGIAYLITGPRDWPGWVTVVLFGVILAVLYPVLGFSPRSNRWRWRRRRPSRSRENTP